MFVLPKDDEIVGQTFIANQANTADTLPVEADCYTQPGFNYALTDFTENTLSSSSKNCPPESLVHVGKCVSTRVVGSADTNIQEADWVALWRIDAWVLIVNITDDTASYIGRYVPSTVKSVYRAYLLRRGPDLPSALAFSGFQHDPSDTTEAPLEKDVVGWYSGQVVFNYPPPALLGSGNQRATKFTSSAVLEIVAQENELSGPVDIYCGEIYVNKTAVPGRSTCTPVHIGKEEDYKKTPVVVTVTSDGEVYVSATADLQYDVLFSSNLVDFANFTTKSESLLFVAEAPRNSIILGLNGVDESVEGSVTTRTPNQTNACNTDPKQSCCLISSKEGAEPVEYYPSSCPCCFTSSTTTVAVGSKVQVYAANFSTRTATKPFA
jgi:hypothetical protein